MRKYQYNQLSERYEITDCPDSGFKRDACLVEFSWDIPRKEVNLDFQVFFLDENRIPIKSKRFPPYGKRFKATDYFMGYIDEDGHFIPATNDVDEETQETEETEETNLISEYAYWAEVFKTGINLQLISQLVDDKDKNGEFNI